MALNNVYCIIYLQRASQTTCTNTTASASSDGTLSPPEISEKHTGESNMSLPLISDHWQCYHTHQPTRRPPEHLLLTRPALDLNVSQRLGRGLQALALLTSYEDLYPLFLSCLENSSCRIFWEKDSVVLVVVVVPVVVCIP